MLIDLQNGIVGMDLAPRSGAEGACTSPAAEIHAFAVSSIVPLVARVNKVDEIALEGRSAPV